MCTSFLSETYILNNFHPDKYVATHVLVKVEMQAQRDVRLRMKRLLFFIRQNWNGSTIFSLKFSTLYLMKILSPASEMFHQYTQKQQQGEINNVMGSLQGCERSHEKINCFLYTKCNQF
jgi:hypothetical protein